MSRSCHEQHKDLPEISGIPKASPWTLAEYDAAVDNLVPSERGEFGLNSGCTFNDSSLGRYVFGSEISYNKAPPRLPGLGC